MPCVLTDSSLSHVLQHSHLPRRVGLFSGSQIQNHYHTNSSVPCSVCWASCLDHSEYLSHLLCIFELATAVSILPKKISNTRPCPSIGAEPADLIGPIFKHIYFFIVTKSPLMQLETIGHSGFSLNSPTSQSTLGPSWSSLVTMVVFVKMNECFSVLGDSAPCLPTNEPAFS